MILASFHIFLRNKVFALGMLELELVGNTSNNVNGNRTSMSHKEDAESEWPKQARSEAYFAERFHVKEQSILRFAFGESRNKFETPQKSMKRR